MRVAGNLAVHFTEFASNDITDNADCHDVEPPTQSRPDLLQITSLTYQYIFSLSLLLIPAMARYWSQLCYRFKELTSELSL
jgi:hypothetical protein